MGGPPIIKAPYRPTERCKALPQQCAPRTPGGAWGRRRQPQQPWADIVDDGKPSGTIAKPTIQRAPKPSNSASPKGLPLTRAHQTQSAAAMSSIRNAVLRESTQPPAAGVAAMPPTAVPTPGSVPAIEGVLMETTMMTMTYLVLRGRVGCVYDKPGTNATPQGPQPNRPNKRSNKAHPARQTTG